jgi:uncharacterized sulfatase
MEKPNILIITTDQQRKDSVSLYNSDVFTPVLAELASDGIVFDRAYTAHPTCTPSRATILTGQFASHHGAYSIGTKLDEDAVMFSKEFKKAGYETYFIGKPHFQQLGTPGSFEYSEHALYEEFWKKFSSPYYGFDHLKIHNGHTIYPFTAGMHYRLWLKEKGLKDTDIDAYFHYEPKETYRTHGVWNIPREYHPSVFVSECTASYIRGHDNSKPFVMWASFTDPHDPHVVPEPYASMYDPKDVKYLGYKEGELDNKPGCYRELYEKDYKNISFADEFGVPSAPSAKFFGDDQYFREITAIHYGMSKLIDEEIVRIISALKEKKIYENTLIIFTTDHGDYLGNHGFVYKGFPAYEEVFNVPLIVKPSGKPRFTGRSKALFSHVDIAETILDAAGLPIPDVMDGRSQLEVLTGSKSSINREIFIENRPVEKGFYQKMIVTDRYKMVVYQDSYDGELYDLIDDPNQYENLWADTGFQDVLCELAARLTGKEYGKNLKKYLDFITALMHAEEPVQKRTSFS